MDYKAFAQDCVKKALAMGADEAEVYIEADRGMSIEVRNGDIETIEEASTQGAGFRVFKKRRMAFSSCNDFSPEAVDNAIKSAVGMAKVTTADDANALPDNKEISKVKGLYDPSISTVSMDEKINLAKQVEKVAMRDRRITKSAGSSYYENEGEIILANSHNLLKSYKSSFCGFGIYVVAEKGEQKCTGGEYCSRRFFTDFETPEEVGRKAAKEAYEMLDPQKVKTQKAAVIFHPDVARSILGGILAAINGESVLQNASFLGDKLDQRIGSDHVTIIDDGLRPKGPSSKPFDGEGVPTQKRIIVEKGFLKGFMYNTIVANRAGTKSTGNASRGDFTSLPEIGCHNFYMKAGETIPEDIISSTKRGLYLKGVTGYGINRVNGNFSGGAQGFWIENGRIAFPVKGLTIAGHAFDMLDNVDMVGNDLDMNRGFTAPTFRIKEIQIGGE